MSTVDCEHWHGLIALEVVGQLDDAQRAALDAHGDQCPACREERRSLAVLSGVMAGADPERVDPSSMPLSLEKSVLGFLRGSERRQVAARRRRYLVVSGAAAAACLAILSLVLSVAGGPTGRTVSLTGPGGARATATLTAESWGTSVRLSEPDPQASGVLTLWMRTSSKTWWEAGTFRASEGRLVQVTMACAVPASTVDQVWVRNSSGQPVLEGYVT